MEAKRNANNVRFETVTIFNVPMLFTQEYIEPQTIPKGMFQYAVRHDKLDAEKPTQITDWVLVNRYGSLLSSVPISMEKVPGSYIKRRDLTSEEDWQWSGYSVKLDEYLAQYPVSEPPKRQNHER